MKRLVCCVLGHRWSNHVRRYQGIGILKDIRLSVVQCRWCGDYKGISFPDSGGTFSSQN